MGSLLGWILAATVLCHEIELLPPGGPFAVGVWVTAFMDDSRLETVTADTSDYRELVVRFWYPAADSVGPTSVYMDSATAGTWVSRHGFPTGFERGVRTHSREGAEAASGRFPVLLFSHGLSWPSLMYQSYMEDLASHGYVVAAIDHSYGADVVVFPDGRIVRYGLWPAGFTSDSARNTGLAAYVGTWAQDIRFVADHLDYLANDSRNPLAGRLDLDRVGALGHSYGGSAVALALDSPRLKAGLAMEGRVRDSAMAPLAVPKPFMHIIGGFNRDEMAGSQYRAGGGPYYEIVVNGMWHAMFSDLIYIYSRYADSAWHVRHTREISPARGLKISRALARAFFDRTLMGRTGDLLHPWWEEDPPSQATSAFPEVELRIDVP